jgi:O-acetyl-ADP-ribose deacetylase (regulator of RNase III)
MPRPPIEVIEGDITKLALDAIINAANRTLLGGGGVDGAIHRAAGPRLREACAALCGCNTGEAKMTPGFDLPARYVIHTVGPVWRGGTEGEDGLLANCYCNSLALAREHGLRSIAFPAISTGAYGFPPDRAARIAVDSVISAPSFERVVLCCFDRRSRQLHDGALADALSRLQT